jgi:NADH:ubiquinone oxidoreductase subunit F (NADH-binding)
MSAAPEATAQTTRHGAGAAPAAPAALPRLLSGIPDEGTMTLAEHLAVHGPMPLERRRGRWRGGNSDGLIEEIAHAGLLGHGGAAFPAATKLRAVASARGRAIVVANGAEGEPASLKDHTLLEMLPHLVLDGAVAAAQAVGADEAIVATCEFAGEGLDSVARAIEEREAAADGARGPRLRLVVVPGHYVAGQETALVNFLNGGPAKPLFTPPMAFERGVGRRPTLVSNVETLAHMALIARHGGQWFRELGTASQPGSALVTLSGPVAHPGVYEIEHGASLASLIEAGGGATTDLRGALIGGYAGSWIGAGHLHGVALSNEHLAPHSATLGAGVVLLLSEHACPVAETVRLARWLAGQSARQCGPCVHGLDALATAVAELGQGAAQGKPAQRIDRLGSLVTRRGACGHPDGAVNVIFSALETFAAEFADHARHGACDACARPPELPLPVRPVSEETLRRRGTRG